MEITWLNQRSRRFVNPIARFLVIGLTILILSTSASGNECQLVLSSEVFNMFAENQLPPSHSYYKQKRKGLPKAIFAVDKKYTIGNPWILIEVTSDEFKKLIDELVKGDEPGKGYEVFDSNGQRLGALLSKSDLFNIQLKKGNKIAAKYKGTEPSSVNSNDLIKQVW